MTISVVQLNRAQRQRDEVEILWKQALAVYCLTHNRNIYVGIRFEVFTAVGMKNGVFWDVTPRGSCKN
jgi:hypothetical protein